MSETPQKSPERSWAASRGFVNAVQGQLPAAIGLLGREAVGHYCSTLVPIVRAAFLQEVGLYDQNEKSFPEWLNALIQNIVRERFALLIKDNDLIDEELVRLATSGLQTARNHLIHRWLPMIKNFVAATVHAHDVCPSSTDVDAFIEDVSQEVGLRLVENLEVTGVMPPKVAIAGAVNKRSYRISPARVGQAGEPFLHSCPDYRE